MLRYFVLAFAAVFRFCFYCVSSLCSFFVCFFFLVFFFANLLADMVCVCAWRSERECVGVRVSASISGVCTCVFVCGGIAVVVCGVMRFVVVCIETSVNCFPFSCCCCCCFYCCWCGCCLCVPRNNKSNKSQMFGCWCHDFLIPFARACVVCVNVCVPVCVSGGNFHTFTLWCVCCPIRLVLFFKGLRVTAFDTLCFALFCPCPEFLHLSIRQLI